MYLLHQDQEVFHLLLVFLVQVVSHYYDLMQCNPAVKFIKKFEVHSNIHSKCFSINDSGPPNDQMFFSNNMSEVSQMVSLCFVWLIWRCPQTIYMLDVLVLGGSFVSFKLLATQMSWVKTSRTWSSHKLSFTCNKIYPPTKIFRVLFIHNNRITWEQNVKNTASKNLT